MSAPVSPPHGSPAAAVWQARRLPQMDERRANQPLIDGKNFGAFLQIGLQIIRGGDRMLKMMSEVERGV